MLSLSVNVVLCQVCVAGVTWYCKYWSTKLFQLLFSWLQPLTSEKERSCCQAWQSFFLHSMQVLLLQASLTCYQHSANFACTQRMQYYHHRLHKHHFQGHAGFSCTWQMWLYHSCRPLQQCFQCSLRFSCSSPHKWWYFNYRLVLLALHTTVDLDERTPVQDGYITWTKKFWYLGSWISDYFKDDHKVETRVKKAYSQFGALRSFFRCPYISIIAKYKIYLAIPVNTTLWGCESWSVTANIKWNSQRLPPQIHLCNPWHLKAPRRDWTNLKWHDPKMVQQHPLITDIAAKRQLNWIGHVARIPQHKIQWQLLLSWSNHPWKPGHPQISPRNTYAATINMIILECDSKIGIASTWFDHAAMIDHAAMKEVWELKIDNWWTSTARPPLPDNTPPLPDFSSKLRD